MNGAFVEVCLQVPPLEAQDPRGQDGQQAAGRAWQGVGLTELVCGKGLCVLSRQTLDPLGPPHHQDWGGLTVDRSLAGPATGTGTTHGILGTLLIGLTVDTLHVLTGAGFRAHGLNCIKDREGYGA